MVNLLNLGALYDTGLIAKCRASVGSAGEVERGRADVNGESNRNDLAKVSVNETSPKLQNSKESSYIVILV